MANAIIAAILSFFIPGLGQVYVGDWKKGVIFFIIAVIAGLIVYLFFVDWIYYIVNLLISIYIAYDAYLLAKE